MKNTKCIFVLLFFHFLIIANGQSPREKAYDEWRARRVGLFIHWGPSAGLGTPESHSHARKSVLNPHGSIPAEEYDQLYKKFNPVHYNPDALVKLAYSAGMRYSIFVAKHHDGFCLFDTKATDYNIMATPYHRDVAKMFADACHRQGMALGWQFSPKDWKHPDYATDHHDRYNTYYTQLLDDLTAHYGPVSIMWFDGIEPVQSGQWKDTPAKAADMMYSRHPNIMLGTHGAIREDFVSFEIAVGPFDRHKPWETAEGINPSGWIFNKPMPTFPFRDLLRNMVYSVGRDGNYLLDVGPMPDGSLYPPDSARLEEFAEFMKVNAEAIHATRGGPYRDGIWGASTCKDRSVYLFISDAVGQRLDLPALPAKIITVSTLDGQPLKSNIDKKGLHLYFPDRSKSIKPFFKVVKLELNQPAYELPVIDGQANLAAASKIKASGIKDNDVEKYGTNTLFDQDGATAWETPSSDTLATLDLDLGKTMPVSGISIAEKGQIENWNHGCDVRLKIKLNAADPWHEVLKHKGAIGSPPVLMFNPVKARYAKLEIRKRPGFELQLDEFRLFGPLK